MADTIIQAQELVKYYRKSEVPAIDKLSLDIKQGEIFTLLGRNGAGKTTFLRIATTQLLPTSGSIRVFGLDVVKNARPIRRRIAITPQEGRPLFTLNARDHLALSLMMRGESHAQAIKKTDRVLRTLDLESVQRVRSEELSGGLKQRILIAMTLASDVELMFLDEPTIGLDPVNRRKVWDELIRLKNEQGRTIVLTTHYMDEAEALSDELAIVERGRVLTEGTPREVMEKNVSSRLRVDVSNGFAFEELASYGKVTRAGNLFRVFANERVAQEISSEALKRSVPVFIGPVTLDDVFIELVGSEIEEEESGSEDMHRTREVMAK
ncbi:MAG: ABC transporter ATP-binding protein [Nitrososphaerales archaeon]